MLDGTIIPVPNAGAPPVEARGLYPYNAAAHLVAAWAGLTGQHNELLTNATPPSRQRRLRTIARPPVLSRLLWFWLPLLLVAAAVLALDVSVGLSLLWGVSVSALPSACFAWYGVRRMGGARQSQLAVHAIYRAETIKFLLTAALFAAVFMRVEQIHPLVFFAAFVVTHIGSSLVTARVMRSRRG